MESNKKNIETSDLIRIKKMLDKKDMQGKFNEDQLNELKLLLDKEIKRINYEKIIIEKQKLEVNYLKNHINVSSNILKFINYSVLFAAVGASSGIIIASASTTIGSTIGTMILPGLGTMIGALLGILYKATVDSMNNQKDKLSDNNEIG